MSRRTRDALAAVGHRADGHRSHQLTDGDIEDADLIMAMAGEHVAYIRRLHPEAASKTGRSSDCAATSPRPGAAGRADQALGLGDLPVEAWEDVEDPAGGEDDAYVACAKELVDLCAELAPPAALISGRSTSPQVGQDSWGWRREMSRAGGAHLFGDQRRPSSALRRQGIRGRCRTPLRGARRVASSTVTTQAAVPRPNPYHSTRAAGREHHPDGLGEPLGGTGDEGWCPPGAGGR